MWTKITTVSQLTSLQAGENIIKYPITGESVADFSEANPDNISVRVITQNDPLNELVDLTIQPGNIKYHAILGMSNSFFQPQKKSYDSIIREENWWFFDQPEAE